MVFDRKIQYNDYSKAEKGKETCFKTRMTMLRKGRCNLIYSINPFGIHGMPLGRMCNTKMDISYKSYMEIRSEQILPLPF